MEIGIGLPGHARWSDGRLLVEWARRAEARGFSTIAVSDRLLWSTPEPLITLAAVAGATSRIRLLTSVLLAPLRTNHRLLAKAVATLDQLAGPHRLQLGMAAGFREDDFDASGADYRARGASFTALLDRMTEVWEQHDSENGPRPATPGGPPLLFGGTSPAALRRITTRGAGWVAGTATPAELQEFVPQLCESWTQRQRRGAPWVTASVMYALGPDSAAAVSQAIGPYYAFAGPAWAQHGISTAVTAAEEISATVADFARSAACDELIFTGNDPDPVQVDLLADELGM